MGIRSCALAGALLVLTACATDSPPPVLVQTSTSAAEVGQVNLDIVSINDWTDVEKQFKPAYDLTGQAAIAAVNKAAAYDTAATRQATQLEFGLAANGPTISKSKVSTTDTAINDGVATTKSEDTTDDESKLTTPDGAPATTSSLAASLAASPYASQAPSLAPEVGYQAADALYRYVTVLNQGYGQVVPCGYVPVLVTFRISIIPNKHNQPYDTFLDLNFVPSLYTPNNSPHSLVETYDRSFAAKLTVDLNQPLASGSPDTSLASDPLKCGHDIGNNDIGIVSFSSDSLENSQNDVTTQQMKALVLAAAISAGVDSASAKFQHLSENVDHLLSLKPNSLLSVAVVGHSGLRIRLGANRFGSNDYELLPLEHNVSIVLLVPYQTLGAKLTAFGHYHFVDARTGVEDAKTHALVPNVALPDTTPAMEDEEDANLRQIAAQLTATYGWAGPIVACLPSQQGISGPCKSLADFAAAIYTGNFGVRLQSSLNSLPPGSVPSEDDRFQFAADLKNDLLGHYPRPGHTQASRDLPPTLRRCPPPESTLFVKDNGDATTVSVRGADGYAGVRLFASLDLTAFPANGGPAVERTLSGTFDIATDEIGDLAFPSFSQFPGFVAKTGKAPSVAGILTLYSMDGLRCDDNNLFYSYAKKPDAKDSSETPGVTMWSGQIGENQNKGSIAFSIDLKAVKADSVEITWSNAGQLDTVGTTAPVSGKVTLKASGDYSANFSNLAKGKPVGLTFSFKSGKTSVAKTTVALAVTRA